jgi:hypothetical protein
LLSDEPPHPNIRETISLKYGHTQLLLVTLSSRPEKRRVNITFTEMSMSNMSYCRFQNTLPDLQDCYNAMGEKEPDELSYDERLARWKLIKLCKRIADDYEHEFEAGRPKREVA